MANVNLPNVEGMNNVEELKNAVAKLTKELLFILNNLDTRNVNELNAEKIVAESITSDKIAANSITADRMDVNELSAISANLGHITAGLIETVTLIGSLIQTNPPGVYPRIELSSTNRSLLVEGNVDNKLQILSNGGIPFLQVQDHFQSSRYQQISGNLMLTSTGSVNINTIGGGLVFINGVDVIGSLNNKANSFSGYNGSIALLDPSDNIVNLLFSNGIFMGTF